MRSWLVGVIRILVDKVELLQDRFHLLQTPAHVQICRTQDSVEECPEKTLAENM